LNGKIVVLILHEAYKTQNTLLEQNVKCLLQQAVLCFKRADIKHKMSLFDAKYDSRLHYKHPKRKQMFWILKILKFHAVT